MNDPIIRTRPVESGEAILKDKFAESIAQQSELMDKLGQQLIAIELAIPGLYATALKLISGEKATLSTTNPAVYIGFAFWFGALVLTLLSLIPRRYTVDRSVFKSDPDEKSALMGIEDFFHQSARYKRRLLIGSSILFFIGIICVAIFGL
jgi:hypothetical protein